MISEIKPKLQPLIFIIAKPFTFIHPNILTLVGLTFPVLYLYFMSVNSYWWALLMLVGTMFDTLDGAVARLTNRITKFGALLDSTADRLADGLIIVAFYYAKLISIEFVLISLIISYLISYIRSRAELAGGGQFTLNVGLIERPERMILIGLATIAAAFPTQLIFGCTLTQTIFYVLIVLSGVTVAQRLYKSMQLLT